MFDKIKKVIKKLNGSDELDYVKSVGEYIEKKHKAMIDAQIQRQNDISEICDEHMKYLDELSAWFEEQEKLLSEEES